MPSNKTSLMFWAFLVGVAVIFSLKALAQDNSLEIQIAAKEAEIKRLQAQEEVYKKSLSSSKIKESTLRARLGEITKRIEKLRADIKLTRAKISKTRLAIKKLDREINETKKQILYREKSIRTALQSLYELESGNQLVSILKSPSLSSFLSQAQYLKTLNSSFYENLQLLNQEKRKLAFLKSGQLTRKEELEELDRQLSTQDKIVTTQKKESGELLKATQNQEKFYQKLISEIQARQAEIQKEVFKLEDQLRGRVAGFPSPRPNILTWPLVGRLTQRYGPTNQTGFYNDVYKFHNGVDIALVFGAPIKAALDGVVSGIGDNGHYAYGKWVSIRHSNGLTTLYSHLSGDTVSIGDQVAPGQIIGFEGDTGFVTGPHLHFTVYATNTFRIENRWFGLLPLGGSLDPLPYF